MPTVRKGSRQVSTQALPGVRLTAAETPQSRGAGLAIAKGRTTEAIGELAGTVASVAYRLHEDAQREADQTAQNAVTNKADKWELDNVYGPQGALQRQGSDAFDLPKQTDEGLTKLWAEIEPTLGTARQKQWFERFKERRGMDVQMAVARHVNGQIEGFHQQQSEAKVKNKYSLAVANAMDPGTRVKQEMTDGLAAIQQEGERRHSPQDIIDNQKNAFRSDVHVGVINNLLANEQTGRAQIHFQEAKAAGEIAGDQLDDLTNRLNTGTTRAEAQKETARILAMGLTPDEQRAEAKKIKNADVQDDTLARLEHEHQIKRFNEQQAEEARSRSVYDTLDKTRSVDQIDPATWSEMSGGERSAARSYADHLAAGKPIPTDWNLFYAMKTMASTEPGTTLPDGRTPLNREDFLTENLTQYRSVLGDSEFKELIELQASIRKGDAQKTTDALGGFQTKQQLLNNSLITFGLNPNPDEKTAAGKQEASRNAQIARTLDARVAAFEAPDRNGKSTKASHADIQQMLDDILTQGTSVTQPNGFFSGWLSGNFAPTKQVPKHLYDLTVADIPAALRSQIDAALRALGQPVMDQTRLDYYRNSLVK